MKQVHTYLYAIIIQNVFNSHFIQKYYILLHTFFLLCVYSIQSCCCGNLTYLSLVHIFLFIYLLLSRHAIECTMSMCKIPYKYILQAETFAEIEIR